MKKNFEIWVEKIPIWLVISSMFVLGALLYIASQGTYKTFDRWTYSLITKNLLEIFGTTMISASLVSCVIEISSLKHLLQNAYKGMLDLNFPLDGYSLKQLESLNKRIAICRLNEKVTEKEITNSVYEYEQNLLDLLDEPYFEYHNQNTVLTPITSKHVFKKKISTNYKLVNKQQQNFPLTFTLDIYSMFKDINNINLQEELNMSVKLDDIPLKKDVINKHLSLQNIKEEYKDSYDYKIKFDYPLGEKKEYRVFVEYEYEIPDHDLTQAYKMTKPCKNFKHKFYMQEDLDSKNKWGFIGNAYTAFYCNQNDPDSNYKVEQSVNTEVTITFNKWALPGAGYVLLLKKIY